MKRYWMVGYVPKPPITFIGFTNPIYDFASQLLKLLFHLSIFLYSTICDRALIAANIYIYSA